MVLREEFTCSMCGGKYFRASLPHHQKVCASRHNVALHECEYCKQQIPTPEIEVHVKVRCLKAPKKESEIDDNLDLKLDLLDGRDPCVYCKRKFLRDRLAYHEEVCAKIVAKSPRQPFNSSRQRAVERSVHAYVGTKNQKDFILKAGEKMEEEIHDSFVSRTKPLRLGSPAAASRCVAEKSPRNETVTEWKRGVMSQPLVSSIKAGGKKMVHKKKENGHSLNLKLKKDPLTISDGTLSPRPGDRLTSKAKILPSNISSPDNPLAWQ